MEVKRLYHEGGKRARTMRDKYALHFPLVAHPVRHCLACLVSSRTACLRVSTGAADLDLLSEPRKVFRGGFAGTLVGPTQAEWSAGLIHEDLKHARDGRRLSQRALQPAV